VATFQTALFRLQTVHLAHHYYRSRVFQQTYKDVWLSCQHNLDSQSQSFHPSIGLGRSRVMTDVWHLHIYIYRLILTGIMWTLVG